MLHLVFVRTKAASNGC